MWQRSIDRVNYVCVGAPQDRSMTGQSRDIFDGTKQFSDDFSKTRPKFSTKTIPFHPLPRPGIPAENHRIALRSFLDKAKYRKFPK